MEIVKFVKKRMIQLTDEEFESYERKIYLEEKLKVKIVMIKNIVKLYIIFIINTEVLQLVYLSINIA